MKKIDVEALISAISGGQDSELKGALQTVREQRVYKDKRVYEAIVKRAERDHEASRTKEEIDLICLLEKRLLRSIASIADGFSSPVEELYYSFWLFEYFHRSIFGQQCDYPFRIDIKAHFGDADNFRSDYDALASREHFITYFSLVFHSIIGRTREGGVPAELDVAKMRTAARHFELASDWNVFHEGNFFWERGCARVETVDAGKVVDSSESEEVAAFRISLSRLRAFRLARSTDQLADRPVRANTKQLPLKEFRSTFEKTSAYLLHLQFYSEDLSESIHGLELREWLRAYSVLKEIALSHVKREVSGCDWRFMLFSARPEYYVDQLVNAGLTKSSAEASVSVLTFDKKSKDILDKPLIPIGKLLLLAPIVTTLIEPAFSLESMVRSINPDHNHDLAIIGPGLERNIIGSLARAKIRGVRLYVRKGRDEFECDVAFILDDVLFLCECKGKYEVSDFHDYLKLETYLKTSAVEQQQRVSNFYRSNLVYVREALHTEADWVPRQVIDVVITSAKLGRPLEEAGVFITDENIFFAYFSRKKTSVRNGKGQDLVCFDDDRLEGDVKVDSFVDYMRHPTVIDVHRSFLEKREIAVGTAEERTLFRDVECYGEAWVGPIWDDVSE